MAVDFKLRLDLIAYETQTKDTGVASLRHLEEVLEELPTGTASGQMDRVWSDKRNLAATSETLDVLASLTSQLDGSTLSFVELNLVYIRHRSASGDLKIGGGSNVLPLFDNTSDILPIKPGGYFLWFAPNDGITPVAGTGDLLQVDAGAATIDYTVILGGRSA